MISSVDRRSEYVENRAGANVRLNNFLTPYTLDDKSSILNAPCGYSNGVYPSLRPVGGENLLLQSNNFNTNWGENTGVIPRTSGQAGYDGTTDAWLLTKNASTFAYMFQDVSTSGLQTYSVYAKANTLSQITLYINGNTNNYYGKFNLSNGSVVATANIITSNVFDVGGGWYRLSITINDTISRIRIYPDFSEANAGSIFIQDAQLEKGPRANKYIETTTSPATNADFSFTRGSAATRVTKDGLIKNVQILSDELVQNGNFEEIGPEEITNGDFSQIGSENIINGDFSNGENNWTFGTGWSVIDGKATVENQTGWLTTSGTPIPSNKQIRLQFDLVLTGGTLRVKNNTNDFSELFSTVGSYTITRYYSTGGSTSNLQFPNYGSGFSGSIDNVSVKEVGQNWTIEDTWTIGDGVANGNGANGSDEELRTTATIPTGTYKIVFEIKNYVSGSVKVILEGSAITGLSANGVYTIYQTTSTDRLLKFRGTDFYGSIDNVSVKEVGQNWIILSPWIVGDNVLSIDGSQVGNQYASQIIPSLTSGNKYKLQYTVSNITAGQFRINVANTLGTYVSSNGTYEFVFNASSGTSLQLQASTTLSASVSNISLIEITEDTDLPRIDYTNGTGSLLLEPQSTNLFTYSEDFSNSSWIKLNSTLTPNQGISPDGNNNAFKYFGTSTNNELRKNASTTNPYTYSLYVKYINAPFIRLRADTIGTWFDLINGVVATNNFDDASIEDVGNGWYRISVVNTTSSSSGFYVHPHAIDNTTAEIDGGEFYLWGAQLEKENTSGYNGEYATSYIPTSDSSVTRNADVCKNAGSSDLINSTEGVLYAEIASLSNEVQSNYISLSDGTYDNRITLMYSVGTNIIRAFLRLGGVPQADLSVNVSDITQFHKVGFKFKENDFALWIDGVEVAADINGSTLPNGTLTKLAFSEISTTGGLFIGKNRAIAVFTEALTDEELAKITSTTQQEVFYEMRDKMLQINADYYEFGDYTTRLKKLF